METNLNGRSGGDSPGEVGGGAASMPAPATFEPHPPNEPAMAWRSRASSIEGIEREIARIWAHSNI
jgi:hypothetical protein